MEVQALSHSVCLSDRVYDYLRGHLYRASREISRNSRLRSHAGLGDRDLRLLRICKPALARSLPSSYLFPSICLVQRNVRPSYSRSIICPTIF